MAGPFERLFVGARAAAWLFVGILAAAAAVAIVIAATR